MDAVTISLLVVVAGLCLAAGYWAHRAAQLAAELERRLAALDRAAPGRVAEAVAPAIERLVSSHEEGREAMRQEVLRLERGLRERIAALAAEAGGGWDAHGRSAEPGLSPADVEAILGRALEPIEARLREIEEALASEGREGSEETLQRALSKRGFADVVIVSGPEEEGKRRRFLVEARRDGMSYKGPVFLEGSRVVEQRLSPSFPMFP